MMQFVTLLGVVLAITTTAVVVASPANSVATIQTLDELPYDENGKLSTHLLLYPEGGKCVGLIKENFFNGEPYGYQLYSVAGDAEMAFFGGERSGNGDASSCRAACVERGVDRSVVDAPMPQRYFSGRGDKHTYADWFRNECEAVQVTLFNYHSATPLNVFWVNTETDERIPQDSLEYGERYQHSVATFLGHRFAFEDGETNEIVLEHTVEFCGVIAIGKDVDLPSMAGRNVTREIHGALKREWNRHTRVKRTFSAIGFRKGRLPDDLFGSMGAFYYNNRRQETSEEWGSTNVLTNWYEANIEFIAIPWELKKRWQGRLKDLVEAWAGVDLEQTDIYGLRRYEEGSRLLSHVDREKTHAASLIVNVAQGNVAEPWPVEVYDHADRLHQVTMEPGDIVYYESAKCLHARTIPLRGEGAYYVNLFTHYRPVGDDRWFEKENPTGTPEPLMDVGECRLEGTVVKCDDESIGPYLSPTMFTAASGDDLFEWWEMTGDDAPQRRDGHSEL